MIPALLGLYALRDRLDQALGSLEVLAPVIEAWTSSQKNGAPEDEPASPDGAPRAVTGLFDELPAVRRSANGASAPPTSCERCGSAVEQQMRGARKRYCGATCRKAAKAARLAPTNGHGLLPDEVERPFRALAVPDDARSDPDALRPPALACEEWT
jgi:hypothetical protein